MPKIKICGLTSPDDITAVNTHKPDYIGFVFAKSRRQITPTQAHALRTALHPSITPVGVFVNAPPELILSIIYSGTIEIIQLHGQEPESYIQHLRQSTKCPIIKAISVQNPGDVQKWENTSADYLLLDHMGGGTGATFNWDLIGKTQKPYFLAGGLTPQNIANAITKTTPYALDVSSGVEQGGKKCPTKIQNFIRVIRDEN